MRRTGVVTFAAAVPGTAPLVVRTKGSTRVLYGFLLGAVALQFAVLLGLAFLIGMAEQPLLLVIVPFYALQFWFTGRIVREYRALLGPQLAADHTGVWVRTGLGKRPEAVYLPWSAIDGIDTTRKGPTLRIMSSQGEGLYTRRPNWRVRTTRRRFGSAFVVDGRRSAEHPDQLAHRLHQLGAWAHR